MLLLTGQTVTGHKTRTAMEKTQEHTNAVGPSEFSKLQVLQYLTGLFTADTSLYLGTNHIA
jgi:hypothetical protein